MKTILIIYPHWVPSNLAGVHRPRLVANFLPELGWHPIILTVSPEHYEEQPDPDIARTASDKIEVIYSKAYGISKPRLIGDIGLRAFPYLFREALKLISTRRIDFIWIPIPSFYTALIGRLLHYKTKVPYGIDYIDPWVRDISNRRDLRSKLSLLVAKFLEPLAIKKASLISGVSTAYYEPVLERNFVNKSVTHVGMPYGFDPNDHEIKLANISYPWGEQKDALPIIYAGAFLPNSHLFISAFFKAIKRLIDEGKWDRRRHLYFIGTGNYVGTTISSYAERNGILDIVHESRERVPYLHVLNFLSKADTVLVIGSTEKHYTASKTYQALLSKRPVFAIFHEESSAVEVLEDTGAADFLVRFKEADSEYNLHKKIQKTLSRLINRKEDWRPNLQHLDKYSALASAKALVEKLNGLV